MAEVKVDLNNGQHSTTVINEFITSLQKITMPTPQQTLPSS